MEEKRYLKWYNKVGYGSGDMAANCVYSFVGSFVLIYLTDTVGLSAGVIGTLIMFSKFFDGFTDFVFGHILDHTHTRWGKARPWMFISQFGNSILLIMMFAIPMGFSSTAKYVYFFITYTALNSVFYTANNISYAALTSLITKNANERVQMGSIRFMFAMGTYLLISLVTVRGVEIFGGGVKGWRTIAVIYALIGLAVNTISVFSVKELSEEELNEGMNDQAESGDKIGLLEASKTLLTSKFFLLLLAWYLLNYILSSVNGTAGIYYMKYILGDANLIGTFNMAQNVPVIIALAIVPMIIQKMGGMYKLNVMSYILATLGRIGFIFAGYMGSIPLMLVFMAIGAVGTAPVQGDMNAMISATSENIVRTSGKHLEGMIFSCSSVGMKVGGGIGTALAGWILSASGYIANAAQQSASTITALHFLYLWWPMITYALITVILIFLNVEKANKEFDERHGIK